MAKADKKTAEKTETNGALVFEKLGKDFVIPPRTRSGAYDDVLEQLKGTTGVVVIFHAGADAKPANTRRKSLIKSAESKGMDIKASVRAIRDEEGNVDNVLMAQYIGVLKAE